MMITKQRQLKGSKVAVLGGAGFIGSHLVDRLLDEGVKELIIIDNLFCGKESNIKSAIARGAVFYNDDAEIYSSLEYVFSRHSIDIVFNLATKALNYSFYNPSNAFGMNVNVVLNVLELQRKGYFTTLCQFSTSEVYGTAVYEPMDEEHPKHPTTTYAAGKAAADLAVESYVNMFDLDAFIIRPFNNYGPRQNYKGILAGVIPITAYRIYKGQSPEIHGTGLQSRDFIYVEDTVDATIKLLPLLKPGESINVSTDSQVLIKDVVENVCRLMDYHGVIERKDARGADVECHNASNKKIKSLIDYQLTSFTDGLLKTVNWYKAIFNAEGE